MKTTVDTKTDSKSKTVCSKGPSLTHAAAALLLAGLTSCGTSGSVRFSSGAGTGSSSLDTEAMRDAQTRVRNSRVISVNGVESAGKKVQLPGGLTTLNCAIDWPQGGTQEVTLRFRAEEDQQYFLKCAAFPPSVDKLSGTTALSTSAEGFGRLGNRMARSAGPVGAVAGLVIMAPGISLGTIDYFGRVAADIADKHKPVQWVDMMVISEDQSEGVVRFVRVYPSGKVIWEPWDACSNAPGNPQQGRVVKHRQSGGGGSATRSAGTVFRRHEITE